MSAATRLDGYALDPVEDTTGRAPDVLLAVPSPGEWISANDRPALAPGPALAKEMRRHRLTKALIEATGWAVKAAKLQPIVGPVRIVAWVDRPGRVGGRWDPANLAPSAKAVVDGLVRFGVLSDDDWRHVVGPDVRRGRDGVPPRLVLGIYLLNNLESL